MEKIYKLVKFFFKGIILLIGQVTPWVYTLKCDAEYDDGL